MGITDKLQAQIAVFRDYKDNRSAYLADMLSQREDELLGRLKDQLASGQDSYGADLRPSYTEDVKPGGYFNTKSAAERYAGWKRSINVPIYFKQFNRDFDTPNLYVSGRFHSELAVEVTDDIVEFKGATGYADNIIDKYGKDKIGLNETFWRMVMENGVIDELIQKLREGIERI